jgi:hypothetical protein
MNIIFVAGMALTGAILSTPSQAQIPNVTAPTDSVRQGAAGINAAQAETTRTTGNAELDARATVENAEAGVGDPTLGVSANAGAQRSAASGKANAKATARNEQEITRQLNREQSASATASGSTTTR